MSALPWSSVMSDNLYLSEFAVVAQCRQLRRGVLLLVTLPGTGRNQPKRCHCTVHMSQDQKYVTTELPVVKQWVSSGVTCSGSWLLSSDIA
ncbi:hypothetical protein J6590_005505 [Homalodisca vitripennis]|nr:hypothetical protein J6590_005505 [Homalodisca vitripennis]